jgi:hypothetical protein
MSASKPAVPTSHDRGAVIPPDIYDPAVNALRFPPSTPSTGRYRGTRALHLTCPR